MKNLLIATMLGSAAMVVASQGVNAADLIIDQPAPIGVVDVSGSWDGPYIGVFGGYGLGHYSDADPTDFDLDGWVLGLALGANATIADGIVAGVVADVEWSDIGSDDGGYEAYIDWAGSVRAKLGFDGGAFLPYLTAGLAVAGVTADNVTITDSQTHVGWTAGVGVEIAATEDLSVDLQYRYSDYGSQTYDVGGGAFDAAITASQLTVGLNWSF